MASVGDEPITAREVERLFSKAIGKRQIGWQPRRISAPQILEEIIARRLVLAYAQRSGEAASNADLATAQADLTKQLAAQRHTLDDFLAAQTSPPPTCGDNCVEFRMAKIPGGLCHAHPAAGLLPSTPARTGRQRVVGQPDLLADLAGQRSGRDRGPPEKGCRRPQPDPRRQDCLRRRGTTVFGESQSPGWRPFGLDRPARADGRDLFPCRLCLDRSQITTPFRSSLGVHLIHCDDLRPGHKQLAEASGPIQTALGRELLEKLSRVERARTAVRYTGAMPYFKPGTRELMPH